MGDIFHEVGAELRRDRWRALWQRYGVAIVGGVVAVVVIIGVNAAWNAWQDGRNEAASVRYDALEDAALDDFAAAEDNGYGILARFRQAARLAEEGAWPEALAAFDALADGGSVPSALQDFARLQAAIALLENGGAPEDVDARLMPLLTEEAHGLQATARDVLALAYLRADNPLRARDLYRAQLESPTATDLSRARARIMLAEVEKKLGLTATEEGAN